MRSIPDSTYHITVNALLNFFFNRMYVSAKTLSKSFRIFFKNKMKTQKFVNVSSNTLYTLYGCNASYIAVKQYYIRSLFWFRNCFFLCIYTSICTYYMCMYAKESGTNFLKHQSKLKLFPSKMHIYLGMHACMYHAICIFCVSGRQEQHPTPDTIFYSMLYYSKFRIHFIFFFLIKKTDNRHSPYENMHTIIR